MEGILDFCIVFHWLALQHIGPLLYKRGYFCDYFSTCMLFLYILLIKINKALISKHQSQGFIYLFTHRHTQVFTLKTMAVLNGLSQPH